MTQDNLAAAEQVGATLDVLAAALLDARATRYPITSLTGFRRDGHPSASALFGLRLSPNGPGALTVRGLGTVVEGSTARPTAPDTAVAAELLARFGGGAVRGVPVPAHGLDAGQFRLPVDVERSEDAPRPAFPAALAELAADRPTVAPEELSTGSGTEVRLVLPSVFHALAVRGGTAARAAQLAEVAEELFAGAGAGARKEWAVLTASLARQLGAAGTVFAGVSALRVADRPSHASLVVSLANRPVQISELATQLADARPQAEVWTVLLPAGPAAVLVEGRTSPVPAALSNDGQPYRTSSSVAQALIPLPDGASVLVVQLSVAQPEDWELYMTSFADVLKSIQLGWDGVYATQPAAPARTQTPAADPYASVPAQPQPQPQPASAPMAPPAPATAPAPTSAPAPAPAAAAEQSVARKGTAVAVPPADFDPFAPPTPAAAAEAPAPGKGTPVAVPPADFNPFAAPAAAEAPAPGKGTAVAVPPADFDPFAPPAATPATEAPAPGKGTPVAVPPADFDPFAPPAATAATEAPTPGKGTPVAVPPADFDPFAPPAATAATEAPAPGKGTAVAVPPADFDPFAPPTPAPATEAPTPGKGTPVAVPPADFNPFAAPAPSTDTSATPVTAPPVAAPAPAPQPAATADPFGTVMNNQPADPFGTVMTGSSPAPAPAPTQAQSFTVPPPPPNPPTIPAPSAGKGTPVAVPPADFNPFAPPAPSADAPAAAEEQAQPTKGTPVNVPPPDFNPFAAASAPSTAAEPAAPAAPEPPANNPFG
ncbi:hypothetical protein [Kitasatospora sp. HPMI-4]|uniref:hypothetical protein n=1 Tax=Kitasatospora sp. HPMI-4 TaxID=3448443 RepID=UPI003F1C5F1B